MSERAVGYMELTLFVFSIYNGGGLMKRVVLGGRVGARGKGHAVGGLYFHADIV